MTVLKRKRLEQNEQFYPWLLKWNGLYAFLTLLEAIENLTLSLCKCQKWKEQVKISKCRKCGDLTLEALRGGSPDFFGFKFLLLDRLSKALAQLFLVYEHIFWH